MKEGRNEGRRKGRKEGDNQGIGRQEKPRDDKHQKLNPVHSSNLRRDDFEVDDDVFDIAVNILLHSRGPRGHPTAERGKLHRIRLVT